MKIFYLYFLWVLELQKYPIYGKPVICLNFYDHHHKQECLILEIDIVLQGSSWVVLFAKESWS